MNLRGRGGEEPRRVVGEVSLEQCAEDLREVCKAAGAPVVVAHSVGWRPAVSAAAEQTASAVILVSPPDAASVAQAEARPLRLLRLKYLLLLALGRPIRIADNDFARLWLSSLAPDRQGRVLKDLVSESSDLVKLLFQGQSALEQEPLRAPVLVLGGEDDPIAPPRAVRAIAAILGAELREYPGHGHWMLDEDGWESVVNDMHRWLVRTLGEKILLAEF